MSDVVDQMNCKYELHSNSCIIVEDIMKVTVVERMLMRGGKEQIFKFYNFADNLDNIRRIFFMNKKLVQIMSQMEIFKHIFTFLKMNVILSSHPNELMHLV